MHALLDGRCAFGPDGRRLFVSSQNYGSVIAVDARSGETIKRRDFADGAESIAASPDGETLALGAGNRNILLLDSESLETRRVLRRHGSAVHFVEFAPDGQTLISRSDFDPLTCIWDVPTGQLRAVVASEGFGPRVSPDGSGWILASPGSIRRWRFSDVVDAQEALVAHKSWVYDLAYSRDGTRLISTAYHAAEVVVWDAISGHRLEKELNVPKKMDQLR